MREETDGRDAHWTRGICPGFLPLFLAQRGLTSRAHSRLRARPSVCTTTIYSFTSTTTTALQAEKSERSSAATRTALLCSPLARTYEQSQRIRSSSSRGNSVRGHTVQSADIHIHTCMEERGTTHTRSTTDKVPQDSHMCTKKKKGRQ